MYFIYNITLKEYYSLKFLILNNNKNNNKNKKKIKNNKNNKKNNKI